jgi:crotonobetainyl-CoA:carnitine CoA-transferase CaiB-like acyl-CoA transferase
VFRCQGDDRWLAIACSNENEWRALTELMNRPELRSDPRFATLADRLRHQDQLEEAISAWSATVDAVAAMNALQAAGVPAGVCQTAEDRCDNDPQLRALNWMTEITGTKIGRWPVPEFPVRLSRTPSYAGGPIDRGAPCYGEDNHDILSTLLGYSDSEIQSLVEEGVL